MVQSVQMRCVLALACVFALGLQASVGAEFTIRPYVQDVTEQSIVICWESDVEATAVVRYGRGRPGVELRVQRRATRHEVRIANLEVETSYVYEVVLEGSEKGVGGSFRTAVRRTSPFVFAVYGDTRGDTMGHAYAVQALVGIKPHLVVHTGDVVNEASEEDYMGFWRTVNPLDSEWALASSVPLYPVLGNHDLYYSLKGLRPDPGYKSPGPQMAMNLWRRFFVLPTNSPQGVFYEGEPEGYDYSFAERAYSFRYGVAKFIVLDVNRDDDAKYDVNGQMEPSGAPSYGPGSKQYEWLQGELAEAQESSALVFVFLHPSPFSSSQHGRPDDPLLGTPARVLNDLFLRYGVSVVFSGHDHCYERSLYRDAQTGVELNYVIAGGGGAPLYGIDDEASANNPYLITHYGSPLSREFSVVRVSVEPDAGTPGKWWAVVTAVKVLANHGEMFDEFRVAGFDPLFGEVPEPASQAKEPPEPPLPPGMEHLPVELQREVQSFEKAFGSSKGDARYDPQYDLNNDGRVDFRDMAIFSSQFPVPEKKEQLEPQQ